jgi:hypothetical protein
MSYICPVCGYNELTEPPENFSICPSCGTEFGYDDDMASHDELRNRWIASGAKWWSIDESPPEFWSPISQLLNIGYVATDSDRIAIASAADEGMATSIRFAADPNVVNWRISLLGGKESITIKVESHINIFGQPRAYLLSTQGISDLLALRPV